MTGTVLRASGTNTAVRNFLASTHWQPCATYFRGGPIAPGASRKSKISGFNVVVSNAKSIQSQVRSSLRFLASERLELLRMHKLGLHGVLDFGVASKPEAVFSFCQFPNKFLVMLGATSLDMEVSHYGQEC